MLFQQIRGKVLKSFSLLALSTFICFSYPAITFADSSKLQSGPMVGYSEMTEALLWVQTKATAKVKFQYWDKENPAKKFWTKETETSEEDAFTAKLVADQLKPGKKYGYELYIDSKKINRPYPLEFQSQKLWQWRTEPPDFKVAFGSCFYVNEPEVDRPGTPFGGSLEIMTSLYNKHPDVMLWIGDNVYLREADWNTRTGIFHRYTHTRSAAEIQPLLASVHNYAILDDHDFGPNDSDRSYRGKNDSFAAFKKFWGNPTFGTKENPGGYTKFEWADVEFFLVDNRYYRTPNKRKTGDRTMLGEPQVQWLIDSLVSSQATFKVVVIGGQVVNPATGTHIEDYSQYPEEKDKILGAIEKENIKGVLFLTGDRHQTELSKLERKDTYPLYDFTVSPLTAKPYDSSKSENNYLRVPDTLVVEYNFGMIEVTGPRKERKLNFTIYNKDGKSLWTKEIKVSELK